MLTHFRNNRREALPGIQLERAILCNNCETLSDVASLLNSGKCPYCGSIAVAPIANWLQRPALIPRIVDTARRG